MSKNIIISHISDLDGRVSRELYIYYAGIPADTKTIWVEYGKRIADAESTISEWAKDRDVTILDFSITQYFLDKVASVANSVKLFDHHTKSQELIAPDNATLIVDTRESTVSLLQKHFKGNETLFTNICREIDLNLIENINVLEYKLYFDRKFMQKIDKYDFKYMQRKLEQYLSIGKKQLLPKDNYLALTQLKEAKKIASKALIDRDNRIAIVTRGEEDRGIDTDIIAHYMLQNRKIDFALISFDLEKENKRIFSVRKLRENPRSLEEYCESRGGGGRETAGSFSVPLKEFSFCGGLK